MNFFHAVSVFSLALLVMGCGPQTPGCFRHQVLVKRA